MREMKTISSGGRAVSCDERWSLAARAAQPVKQPAEFYGIEVGQFRTNVFFDRGGIRAPHLLLQLAPGLGDLDELTALVDLAFAPRRQPLIDQTVDHPRG